MASQEEELLGKAYDSRLMRRLLGYLRPYQWQVYIALAAIILKSGADVLGPYLFKVAIDKYLALHPAASRFDHFLSRSPMKGIGQIAAIYAVLQLVSFGLDYTQTYVSQWAGQKAMFDMRAEIFRHLQHLHIAFFDRNPVGRLVTRVTSDVDALNEMFTSGVIAIVEDIFVLGFIVTIMLNTSWRVALITFSVLPIIFWATMIFRRVVREAYRKIRVAIARINSYLQEHITGMVVLQLFNRERKSYEKFETVNRSHMDAFKDAIIAHAIYYPVVEVLSAIAISLIIWFGGGRVLNNTGVTVGVVTAFILYAQRFFRPIQDLSEKYNIVQSAMAACERIFKLLDTPVEIQDVAEPKSAAGPGRIEFDQVWFAYRHVPRAKDAPANGSGEEWDWVLRDVSFVLEPGETVAVVGHTGAGKTTLISLLLRFYDVQKGAIKIDGIDIRELSLAELRRRFGVVLQDPFLFTGTIGENIRLGTEWITDEAMMQAAEEVNVAEFIRSQPAGFEQGVHERGSTLSTGQKQLISFARALAHNPKILILDEATSSVDTETEFRVREALTKLVEGRTSLIIAHRLSTIQRADKIIVMHKGKVREMGSHQQLLAERGIYWKLYQLQYKDQEIATPSPATLTPATD